MVMLGALFRAVLWTIRARRCAWLTRLRYLRALPVPSAPDEVQHALITQCVLDSHRTRLGLLNEDMGDHLSDDEWGWD